MEIPDKVLILDFGSQYTQLIARKIRELQVYSEIQPYSYPIEKIRHFQPKALILSGGPSSIHDPNAPKGDPALFHLGIPILGICYGAQWMAHLFGGKVESTQIREYGRAEISLIRESPLFQEMPSSFTVWMSHGDHIDLLPKGFEKVGISKDCPVAAFQKVDQKIFALQFHPEVHHTQDGKKILANFLFSICQCRPSWELPHWIHSKIKEIQSQIGSAKAVSALSGGVDSSVASVLVHQAIGDQLTCIFVDNGLLRMGEKEQVEKIFQERFHIPLRVIDGRKRFLEALKGVTHPEEKRKRIGHTFIQIFEEEARKIKDVEFLVQGTLYPDVIESISVKGPTSVIKSHHNVGGLPERMQLKLVEPLRELFKDEVRELGKELGLPNPILERHPFPGPGLAIRTLGEVKEEDLEILRKADRIVQEEIQKHGFYNQVWQAFPVLLPLQTVGVMGDQRTYEKVMALRVVESVDGMTADWARLPYELLDILSRRIINEVAGINRMVYDISSKPPSTIEWE